LHFPVDMLQLLQYDVSNNNKTSVTNKGNQIMKIQITISKNDYGYLVLEAIVGDRFVTKKYSGYTKKEAISDFKEVCSELIKKQA